MEDSNKKFIWRNNLEIYVKIFFYNIFFRKLLETRLNLSFLNNERNIERQSKFQSTD